MNYIKSILKNDNLIFIAAVIIFLLHYTHLNELKDDAFITYRYAVNLVEGHGLNYNIGEPPVEGYTNFLWVIICAVLYKIGLSLPLWSRVISVISSMLTLFMIFRFSKKRSKGQGYYKFTAVFMLAFSSIFVHWSGTGLETGFYTFLITASVITLLNDIEKRRRFPLSSALFALTAMTRPDGVMICAACGIYFLIILAKTKDKPDIWNFIKWAGTFSALFLTYWFARYWYFGDFFPNTFYVKTGVSEFIWFRGLKYIFRFAVYNFIAVFIIKWAVLGKKLPLSIHNGLFITVVTIYLLTITALGGDYMKFFRFIVPILPLIFFIAQESLIAVNSIFTKNQKIPAIIGVFFIFQAFSLSLPLHDISVKLRLQPLVRFFYIDGITEEWREFEMVERMTVLGKYFNENMNHQKSVAITAIGAFGYYSEMKILDLYGLVDREFGKREVADFGKGWAGHEKYSLDLAIERQPDYYIFSHNVFEEKIPNSEFWNVFFQRKECWPDLKYFVDNYHLSWLRLDSPKIKGYFAVLVKDKADIRNDI